MEILERIKEVFTGPTWDGTLEILPESYVQVIDESPDGFPLLGMFNSSYLNYRRKKLYPWCLRFTIHMQSTNLTEIGLPYDAELRCSYRIEQLYMRLIPEVTPCHYLGHLMFDGKFTIWWYVRNGELLREFLREEHNRPDPLRIFTYEIEFDHKWKDVQKFLEIDPYAPKKKLPRLKPTVMP
ncbi:MAG: DUF695 domain-containing protein [Bacteroidetes bacterium]|nr:DUF695 domain-containing protein [Bacteroidota bacterium]